MSKAVKIVRCYYCTSDKKIQQLGDLKIKYALTKDFLIKSLLRQAEDLIVLRVGSAEILKKRLKSIANPTLEQRCFIQKLKDLVS